MEIKRGQIYYADLGEGYGSEQGGLRPVVVVQNDMGNRYSPTIIMAPLTTKMTKKKLPTHLLTECTPWKSLILCEQIKVIDKKRLRDYICTLPALEMERVNKALQISLGI